MKKFTLMLLMVFALGLTTVMAQGRQISGTVTDSGTNQPLIGATIIVQGTQNGGYSMEGGKFVIANVTGAVTLEVSFTGYKEVAVPVAATATEVNVKMTAAADKLDEVVVIAYGKADKKSLTGSVATVSEDDIAARPVTNVTSAIAGTSPGIRMLSASGAPGSSPSFQIRGVGSINSSTAPLYVVDGIPYTGDISLINSDDIANMSILKDAASTALYGSKGSNGVIMITTKTGRKDKIAFNVKINEGIMFRAMPEYEKLNAEQWYEMAWETYRNDRYFANQSAGLAVANEYATENLITNNNMYNIMGDASGNKLPNNQVVGYQAWDGEQGAAGWAYGVINPNASYLGDYAGDLDWMDAASGIGFRQNYSISASGGSDKATYFGSLGYVNEDSYFDYASFERITARLKTDVSPTKWLRFGVNINTSYSEKENPYGTGSSSYNNPWYAARNMAPIYPVHAHDTATGDYILDGDGNTIYDDGFATTYDNGQSKEARGQMPGRHPLYEGMLNKNSSTALTMTTNAYAEIRFLKDFRFMIDGSLNNRMYYTKDYENPIIGDGAPGGRFTDSSTRYLDYNFKQQLNWERTFGDHTVSALAGHENFSSDYHYLSSGMNASEIMSGIIEVANYSTLGTPDGYSTAYRSEGYFGRVNYDYQEKYYFSASYRRDGSSKFAPENRWGNFWSVGGSWIVSAENFMADAMWVDFLKARVSYGTNGNDNGFWNDRYMYQPLYSLGAYGTTAYAVWDTNGAPSVTWETAAALDLGIEFRLWNRFNGDIGFYNKSSDKLLFDVPQPLYSGVSSETMNMGSMYNRGFEFAFDVDAIRNNDWVWNIGLNASTYANKITDLPQSTIDAGGSIDGTKKIMVGHSRYEYWLRQFAFIDPADGASVYLYDDGENSSANEWDPSNNSNQFEKDGVKYSKSYGDAKYDWSGNALPALDGAISSSLTWKNLSLDILVTYRIGGKAYDSSYTGILSPSLDNAVSSDIYNSWRKPGDVASLPRLQTSNTNLTAQSNRQLIDNSYVALQNITLTYTFPKRIASKLTLSGLSVYASGESLFQISGLKGYDATSNFNGTTSNSRFGSIATLNFGVNVSF